MHGVLALSASVGANATNRKADVETVQPLLNRVPVGKGGPAPALAVDGLCYGKTLAAISRFQKVGCGFQWPDQRIEPNRRTWNELVLYAEDTPSERTMIRCYPRNGEASGSAGATAAFAAPQSGAGTSGAAGAPTAASLVADAKIHLPLAIAWITSTQVRLGAVRQSIARFKVYSPAELELARPFATHVKVNIASQTDVVALSRLDRVAHTFGRIHLALGGLGARLIGNPSEPAKAVAPLGGSTIRATSSPSERTSWGRARRQI